MFVKQPFEGEILDQNKKRERRNVNGEINQIKEAV